VIRRLITFATIALCVAMNAYAGPTITRYGVTINNMAEVYPGNVLFADCDPPNPDGTAKIYLVDPTGKILKTWRSWALLSLAKPIGTDGSILTWRRKPTVGTGCADTTGTRELYKIDANNVPTKIYFKAGYTQSHDFEVLPDGTFLVLESKLITNPAISTIPFNDDIIERVDASGNVLWSWSTADHYS